MLAEPIVDKETGEIVAPETGTTIDRRTLDGIIDVLESNANLQTYHLEQGILDEPVEVQSIKVEAPNQEEGTTTIIGNAFPDVEVKSITPSDIVASMSYFFNLLSGVGHTDDIDHLSNRRLRSDIGELLQNQFSRCIPYGTCRKERMSIQDAESITPQQLINIRPVIASIKGSLEVLQLSQFMDQTNPLAELTHKRRLSALGPAV